MQAVKDSFYMALRDRFSQLNPLRTLADGTPAVIVCENENEAQLANPEAFYLSWLGDGTVAADAAVAGWHSLRCEISYRTQGTNAACGVDRGRVLAQLDDELNSVLTPRATELKDFTITPESSLDSTVIWGAPKFQDAAETTSGQKRTVVIEILWREDA